MRKLCDSVDRFCLQHPRFGIPNLMKFLVGIMAVVFVLDLFSNGYASYMLYFNAELVLQGELWRLVTWMFLPTNGSLFWIFISLSFYYFIGTSIEEYWGTRQVHPVLSGLRRADGGIRHDQHTVVPASRCQQRQSQPDPVPGLCYPVP